MSQQSVNYTRIENRGDNRGESFSLMPDAFLFLGEVRHVHYATIVPDAVRGNHYHVDRRELIFVVHQDHWVLAWDNGENTPIHRQIFEGAGAVLLQVGINASHAISNTGRTPISIVAFSNKTFTPGDTVRRVII